jgi:FHA domain
MADEQATARQITGDDIIAEILRNAEQGIFKIRYTALLPSIYHIYLHPSDFDTIQPVVAALIAEARQALMERLDELNRNSKPSALARKLGFHSGKHVEFKTADPDWTIEFHPDTEERLERAEIEIYSELASAQRPEFGEGALTRHVTKRLKTGEISSARVPTFEVTTQALPRTGSHAFAYIRYEDPDGAHVFTVNKNQIVIGRGGKSFWVDLKLNAPPDVSREHCRIRRDPATRQFFLKDVSNFGTTLDGKRIPGSLEDKDGQARDLNLESQIPARAVIGLADKVFLHFEAANEGSVS